MPNIDGIELIRRVRALPQYKYVPIIMIFERLNFMDSIYNVPGRFEAIFFRNVMIYFEQADAGGRCQPAVPASRAGGYLFAGHSESLDRPATPLRQVGGPDLSKVEPKRRTAWPKTERSAS